MAEFVGSASKIAVLDFINGGLDDDRLEGGSGSDRFTASFGHDVIVGGSGGAPDRLREPQHRHHR
ncbi:MAG: hypothetical protein M3453_15880 [Pseudomonadota bacterium]|nr:hypothetical protein [Pseudomonadota bacterium]